MFKKLKSYLKPTYPVLLFLGISLILHVIAIKGDFSVMINGGDIDYPLNTLLELKRSINVWSGEALGVPEFFAISKAFLIFPKLIIDLLIPSQSLANILYFSLLRALPGIFMYYFLSHLKINKLGIWVGSLFFMLNTFIYLRFQFPQPHLYFAYASLPLLLLITVKIIDKSLNAYVGAGLLALVMMSISRTANMYLLYWVLVPIIALILVKTNFVVSKVKFVTLISVGIITLLLNSVVFISFVGSALNYADISTNSVLAVYREDAIEFAKDYKLYEVAAGFGSYAWTHKLSTVIAGDHNFPILGYFSGYSLFIIALVPIIFAYLLSIKNIKRLWPYLLLVMITSILATGFGQPFGAYYQFLVERIPLYSDFFRDSWTYWSMPYFFVISLILAIGFNRGLNFKLLKQIDDERFTYTVSRVLLLVFLLVSLCIYYLLPGKLINPAWVVKLPYGYNEMANYLNLNAKGDKVLALPLTRHVYGYTYYDWGYAGPDVMHRLADVDYIDKFYNQIAKSEIVSALDSIIIPDPTTLNEFLFKTQTNWILLRNDFIDKPGDGSKNRLNQTKAILNNFECWKIVSEYGDLTLYQNSCSNHSKSNIQMTQNIVYGGNECMYGLPTSSYIANSSICGKGPKTNNFLINGDDNLVIENQDSKTIVTLQSKELELIDNYNFTKGVWNNGDLYTCDPEDPNPTNILTSKLLSSSGMKLFSSGQKICIFEPIKNTKIQSGGILKVSHSIKNKQDIRYCLFGISDNYCYISGTLGKASGTTEVVVKRDESFGYINDYVYFKKLSTLKDKSDMYIYLYFNDEKENNFNESISEVRFTTLPNDFSELVKSNNSNSNVDLNISKNIWGYKFKTNDKLNGDYVISFNNTKNKQWKLIGIKKDNSFFDFTNSNLITYEYANGWLVQNAQEYDSYVIIYIPQIIFLTGLFLTIWVYIFYVIFWIKGKLQKREL